MCSSDLNISDDEPSTFETWIFLLDNFGEESIAPLVHLPSNASEPSVSQSSKIASLCSRIHLLACDKGFEFWFVL